MSDTDPMVAHGDPWASLKDITAGCCAGVAMTLSGHPLDTLKVRLISNPDLYTGTVDVFKKTVAKDGYSGLYAGVTSPLVGLMAMNSLVFFNYGLMKRALGETSTHQIPIASIALAGAGAGFVVSSVESVADLVKSQMQIQSNKPGPPKYTGSFHCAASLYRANGVRGLYQGLSGTIVRNTPANGIYFGVYEGVKRSLRREDGTDHAAAVFAAGGLGGISYWLLTYPCDMIKTTLQTDSTQRDKRLYKGWMDCARKIFQTKGPKGFLVGITPCLLRSFPANACALLTYETAIKYLNGGARPSVSSPPTSSAEPG